MKSIRVCFILILVVVWSCNNNIYRSEPFKPSIIFILADDLGWSDLGYNGSTFYETPNIDSLAHTGMIFTSAYAASPVCSPTRSSIMTGKAPARTNNTDWFGAPQTGEEFPLWMGHLDRTLVQAPYKPQMDLEEYTIAEVLKGHGYKTFISGKWKLIKDYSTDEVELYNLESDIGESTDLSAINPDISVAC